MLLVLDIKYVKNQLRCIQQHSLTLNSNRCFPNYKSTEIIMSKETEVRSWTRVKFDSHLNWGIKLNLKADRRDHTRQC